MATEKLNISGYDVGWGGGFLSNIDEPVASADGQTISTFGKGNIVVLDVDNVSAIVDADFISSVTVTVRARGQDEGFPEATSMSLSVELLIDSVSRGTASTGNIQSPVFQNKLLTNAGWDVDWTQAQLNSLQLRITTASVQEDIPFWLLDCIDVDITYVSPIVVVPPVGTIVITGKAPVLEYIGQEPIPTLVLSLAGHVPIIPGVVSAATAAIVLAGKPSYVNPVTEQLQINAWDNGWPNGFVSNVDEPSSAADGQIVSTNLANDTVVFDFDAVSSIVDEDDVLGVSLVVRAKIISLGPNPPHEAELFFKLVVDTALLGSQMIGATDVMTNYTVTDPAWNLDLTVDQLNSIQVQVISQGFGIDPMIWQIDTIDLIITYAPQSPVLIDVPAAALSISEQATTITENCFRLPAVETAALLGYVPKLVRRDTYIFGYDVLMLSGKAPTLLHNSIRTPVAGSTAVAGKATRITIDTIRIPAVEALNLAGKVPTVSFAINHLMLPAQGKLALRPEGPLQQLPGYTTLGPAKGTAALSTYVPTFVHTTHVVLKPLVGGVALATAAPVTPGSKVRPTPVAALTVTRYIPVSEPGTIITVASGSLAYTSQVPVISFQFAELIITTYAPVIAANHIVLPAVTAIALSAIAPISENAAAFTLAGALTLAGKAVTLEFSSILLPGDPKLISLTVDRRIEFIATPTEDI